MEDQQSELTEQAAPAHETTGDILRSAIESTGKQNRRAYDLLLALADEGFLDQHQARNAVDTVARQLLDTLPRENARDAH